MMTSTVAADIAEFATVVELDEEQETTASDVCREAAMAREVLATEPSTTVGVPSSAPSPPHTNCGGGSVMGMWAFNHYVESEQSS